MELINVFAVGILATLIIDIWAEFLKRVLGLPVTNWSLVGRWFYHMKRLTLIHESIANADNYKYETALGWIGHYVIGVIYSVFYFNVLPLLGIQDVNLISAFLFGLLTIVFPWFLLQPGLGFGVMARKKPNPNTIRLINISIHIIFGLSLYFGYVLIKIIQ